MRYRSGFESDRYTQTSSYDEARQKRLQSRQERFANKGLGAGDHGLRVILIWAFVISLIIIASLLRLQLIEAGSLRQSAKDRRTNVVALHAKRGTIYDRNGNILAYSEECKTVYANPKEVNDPAGTAEICADLLGGEKSEYLAIFKEDKTFKFLQRQVDESVAKELKTKLEKKKCKGIYFLDDTKRVYPYGSSAAQILGIVGVDGDALSGLELYYDDILKGEDGEKIFEVGRFGTPIAGASNDLSEAKDGTDIIISLDIDIQQLAEEKISEATKTYLADSGSAMVLDPDTGEILAACSTPFVDPNNRAEIPEGATSLKLVSSSYEPGSIFKPLVAGIGIEDKLFGIESSWYVPAQIKVGDDMVGDADERDYSMQMSLREIMRRSSNVGMALIGQDLIGAKCLSEGLDLFLLGKPTGIDFPGEAGGIVKTLDEFDGSTTGNISFGQGLAIPMVQMVQAYGAIANGGTLYTPHFLMVKGDKEVEWKPKGKTFSEKTCADLADIMHTVVEEGTAEGVKVNGYTIAAKTGTAQQMNEEGGGYQAGKYMSSLIGFANINDPSIVVFMGLNGTPYHGGSAMTDAFSAVMSEALADMNVKPAA